VQKRVAITYHFQRDPEGNAPDESHVYRGLEEICNLLAVEPQSDVERRAVNSMTQGFTMDQLRLFTLVITRTIAERVKRADAMPDCALKSAILKDVVGISKRWIAVSDDLCALIDAATVAEFTGLEPSARSLREDVHTAAGHA
jgi:hypothetical protein